MSLRDTLQAATIDQIAHTFSGLREAAKRYHVRRTAYNRTVNELNSLNDRELDDVGFARADIPAIAREAADDAVRDFIRRG